MSKKCPKCRVTHNKQGRFCSRQCANSRVWTDEKKILLSNKMKGYKFGGAISKYPDNITKICKVCSNTFTVAKKYSRRQCCSKSCMYVNAGGYRSGSGHSKSGYYQGIYCGSTYELCWVIWALDNQIKFTRFEKTLRNKYLTYIPDFLLEDGKTIIELKGYESQVKVDAKTQLAESLGYKVVVLRKQNLQHVFDYVKNKFKVTELETLYDDYKPKYQYTCSYCQTQFSTNRKKKTEIKYCSKSCSGKAVAEIGRASKQK